MTLQSAQPQLRPLLQPDGSLTCPGWSAQPELDCNLENARTTALPWLQRFRLKRWDYYGLSTPDYFFSFTLADIGYAASVFAYAVNWSTGRCEEATLTLPPGPRVSLPRNSTEGTAAFKNDQVAMAFTTQGAERRLTLHWQAFGGAGQPDFDADVILTAPAGHESLNLVIPISGGKFYFNRKINCLPAAGWVRYHDTTFTLTSETCLGNLDWGRGV